MFTTTILALLAITSGATSKPATIRVTNRAPGAVNVSLVRGGDCSARVILGMIDKKSSAVLEIPANMVGQTGARILVEPVDNADFQVKPLSWKEKSHAYRSQTVTLSAGQHMQLTVGQRVRGSTLAMN